MDAEIVPLHATTPQRGPRAAPFPTYATARFALRLTGREKVRFGVAQRF